MTSKRLASGSVSVISVVLVALFGSITDAPARGDTIIYAFQGGADGGVPVGTLITDKEGNLYGVTEQGSAGKNQRGGSIFEITPGGTKSVLSYFSKGGAGKTPMDGLLRDGHGNLYGTASAGPGRFGGGTVFKMRPDGKIRGIHLFDCAILSCFPTSNLIADPAGNLYGTTEDNTGTVFRVAPDGTFTTLYTFKGGNDGNSPGRAGLIIDDAGNLYGNTGGGGGTGCGGYGCGTVFKLAPDGTETVIYAFAGGNDGAGPEGSLVRDSTGNFYGTTAYGGRSNNCPGPGGCGTVFKITPDGVESIVYDFQSGTDGQQPFAGLIIDKAGTLYGTTAYGGGKGCAQYPGCGTVFKVTSDGAETVLYAFYGGPDDGAFPTSGLLEKNGYLYGTTSEGGSNSFACDGVIVGCGTVFSVKH